MRVATDSDLLDILSALRSGRTLSDLHKWPWHVSRIEGSLLPVYATRVSAALQHNRSWTVSKPPKPSSARLWKCLYAVMRGLCLSRAASSEFRGSVGSILAELHRTKSGDIYNKDGHNLVLAADESHTVLNGVREDAKPDRVASAKRLCALLFSWAEACAFTEHTNHQECHGAYRLTDGTGWYIHSFHSLNDNLAVELSGIRIPIQEVEVFIRWDGDWHNIDVFNNMIGPFVISTGQVCEAVIVVDGQTAEREHILDVVRTRILEMTNWIESQTFLVQASIYADGYARRTSSVLDDAKDLLSSYEAVCRPGCCFAALERYIHREVL